LLVYLLKPDAEKTYCKHFSKQNLECQKQMHSMFYAIDVTPFTRQHFSKSSRFCV